MNKSILVGRLVQEPVLKSTEGGRSVADFTLACKRAKKRSKTDFIDCVAWEKVAEIICRYCHKGDMLAVVGERRIEKYERPDGTTGYRDEVNVEELEFIGSAGERNDEYEPDPDGMDYVPDEGFIE